MLCQYLRISHILRKLPEPEDQLINWVLLFELALGALRHTEPATETWTVQDLEPKEDLELILDDVQAIRTDLRLVKRIEKSHKLKRQSGDSRY